MFFKTSDAPTRPASASAGATSRIPSLLSADLRIAGDLTSSGEVQVDGRVDGDVSAESVLVSEAGVIEGAIAAATCARILGTVNGTITAAAVKLGKTARVTGDIVHQSLSVEEGAFVLGHLRRVEPEPAAVDEPQAAAGGAGNASPTIPSSLGPRPGA